MQLCGWGAAAAQTGQVLTVCCWLQAWQQMRSGTSRLLRAQHSPGPGPSGKQPRPLHRLEPSGRQHLPPQQPLLRLLCSMLTPRTLLLATRCREPAQQAQDILIGTGNV